MPIKAYIYAEDGALLGYMAYTDTPPEILELSGRFFKHKGTTTEIVDDELALDSLDYWEIKVETFPDVIEICVGCGRNASLTWWKCCPDHLELEGPDVYCQACTEKLHPGDPEFARD